MNSPIIAVVAEGKNDFLVVRALLKRCGVDATLEPITWSKVSSEAPSLFDFKGSDRRGEMLQALTAVAWLKEQTRSPTTIVLLRDTDNRHDRRKLQQAMTEAAKSNTVVVGVAHPKIEAWLLVAYQPQNKREHAALHEQQQLLKFNPCTEPHRLNDKHGEHRDAKVVVEKLGGHHRCADDLETAPWQTIVDRDREKDGGGVEHSRFGITDFYRALNDRFREFS